MQIKLVNSLSLNSMNRRFFIENGIVTISSAPAVVLSTVNFEPSVLVSVEASEKGKQENEDILSALNAKTIFWDTKSRQSQGMDHENKISWNQIRYRSSTLSYNNSAPKTCTPLFYPDWMDGYWSVNYKFDGASFPQGRGILSLRTAGAGLGTCLSLPNVGYNPPKHAAHFITKSNKDLLERNNNQEDITANSLTVFEDLAYNVPRTLETFWPQSKVTSVQTNGQDYIMESNNFISPSSTKDSDKDDLSLKCFLTGDGCTTNENPNLHLPSSRLVMDFNAPTRRSGRLTQTCDMSLVDQSSKLIGTNIYTTAKSISQYNINQELQTFYKEYASYEKIGASDNDSNMMVIGKRRVAAFLPKYIKDMDNLGNDNLISYNDNEAAAIYDYKIFMKRIDESEAANL